MNKYEKEVQEALLDDEKLIIKQLKQVYNKALNDIDDKIALLLGRNDTENLQSIIYQVEYQKALKTQINAILDEMNTSQFTSISEYLTKCYENSYVGTMYSISKQGIPIISPINQELVVKALQVDTKLSKSLYNKLGEDVNMLKKKIKAQLSRGIANNYSYSKIAQELSNYTTIGLNKSIRIARTEGHRIQAQSSMDAAYKAKEAGADVLKQWDSTLDGRTRPSHQRLDGQIKELDDPFEVNGFKAKCPGGFGVPHMDINCRCAVVQRARWDLDEDELEELKKRAEYYGLDKTDDFEDFKKKYLKASEVEPSKPEVPETPTKSDEPNRPLTNDEKEAIEYYVSGDGMYINNMLRERNGMSMDDMTDMDKNFLKDLDSATDRLLGEEQTLYRSVDASAIFGDISQSDYEDLREELLYKTYGNANGSYSQNKAKKLNDLVQKNVGKEITDKGFLSTTTDFDVASEWGDFTGSDKPIVLELKTNKHTRGVDVSYLDENADWDQHEVLLARNQKMKINEITTKDGNIYVKADLIDDEVLTNNGNSIYNGNRKVVELSDKAKEIISKLEKNGIEYKDVKALSNSLTSDEIITRLAGGDRTTGSCSSLGFAYIGNCNGLDVLDFRGGKSQYYFSMLGHIKEILELPNVKGNVFKVEKEILETMEIINNLEYGKEYYLAAGRHAAIIRNTAKGAEFLELQSATSSGWTPFVNSRYGTMYNTLYKRFGCRKTAKKIKVGYKTIAVEQSVVLMEVDSFKDSEDFRKILGYINTSGDEQKKGVTGSVK